MWCLRMWCLMIIVFSLSLSLSLSIYIYIYICIYTYTYMYIYIYIYEEGSLWCPLFWHILCWKRCLMIIVLSPSIVVKLIICFDKLCYYQTPHPQTPHPWTPKLISFVKIFDIILMILHLNMYITYTVFISR